MKDIYIPSYLKNYAKLVIEGMNPSNMTKYELGEFNEPNLDTPSEDKIPKSIHELTEGLKFESYEFNTRNFANLSLLGFTTNGLEKNMKVIVTEYMQTCKVHYKGNNYIYGIGARMMMRISKSSFRAKVDSPQQVTASVVFGRATVKYNLLTIGIVGPGTESLLRSGALTEDTYTNFILAVSKLIVDAYKDTSTYIITPQLLII
jgi:hypothetical protein